MKLVNNENKFESAVFNTDNMNCEENVIASRLRDKDRKFHFQELMKN